jgi:hypothetical protein
MFVVDAEGNVWTGEFSVAKYWRIGQVLIVVEHLSSSKKTCIGYLWGDQTCRQSILIDKASIDIAIAKPARIDIDIDTLLRNPWFSPPWCCNYLSIQVVVAVSIVATRLWKVNNFIIFAS